MPIVIPYTLPPQNSWRNQLQSDCFHHRCKLGNLMDKALAPLVDAKPQHAFDFGIIACPLRRSFTP